MARELAPARLRSSRKILQIWFYWENAEGRFTTQREQAPSPQYLDQRAGGFCPSGTTAMVNRDTQLALPSSLVSRMSQTWVVRPM